MLWGFQSLHMNDGWMDGIPPLPQREEGRKEGRKGGRVPRVTIHNPKLHNSKENLLGVTFPPPWVQVDELGNHVVRELYSYCKIVGLFVEKDAIVKVVVYIYIYIYIHTRDPICTQKYIVQLSQVKNACLWARLHPGYYGCESISTHSLVYVSLALGVNHLRVPILQSFTNVYHSLFSLRIIIFSSSSINVEYWTMWNEGSNVGDEPLIQS